MSTIFFLFALYSNQNADALPVQNLTALPTDISPSWVVGPSGRGTWALLYSCIFTLALCAWTSLHLNVPPLNEAAPKRWLREAKWVLIGLFAPEILGFCAMHQWATARSLLNSLEALAVEGDNPGHDQGKKSNSNPQTRFDMRYAYFVVMGGIAVNISHLHNTLDRATITPEGILFLAKLGHYILPSNEAMQSRAKADYLAKGLVALQVFWICGQAIERKITGYPLTLLEVHTIAHAVSALILYLLWIQKPLNVQNPIIIDSEHIQEPLAFMILRTNFRHHQGHQKKPFMGQRYFPTPDIGWYGHLDRCYRHISVVSPSTPENLSNIKLSFGQSSKVKKETFFKTVIQTEDDVWQDYTYNTIDGVLVPQNSADTVCTLASGQALPSGIGPMEKADNGWSGFLLSLSSKDVQAFELAGTFIRKNLEGLQDLPTHNPIELNDCNRLICARIHFPALPQVLSPREPNFQLSKGLKEFSVSSAMFILPIVYGSMHLAGLSILFPTPKERLLWEISCCVLVGIAGVFGTSALVVFRGKNMEKRGGLWRKLSRIILFIPRLVITLITSLPDGLLAFLLLFTWVVLWLVYLSARLYLIVESFISLRHVPVGAYQTPERNIMGYVPHL